MKIKFQILILSLISLFTLSCGKSEIKTKNSSAPAPSTTGPAQPNSQTLPPGSGGPAVQPPVIANSEELVLTSEILQLSVSGSPLQKNSLANDNLKSKSKLKKTFNIKSSKSLTLKFAGIFNSIGHSQCEGAGTPEVTAIIKINNKESSSKYSDLKELSLESNQDLQFAISIDNSLKCKELIFEFAVLATEVLGTNLGEPPPVVIIPTPGQLVVETKEFISAGSFGACFDLACFTRDLKTSTKTYTSPNNKLEEIVEDHFLMSQSLQLVCLNRRALADNTGMTNSVCKLIINPTLSSNEIKLYRGIDKKSNLVGADISEPALLEKLCNKFPTVSSDDKVEVFIDETNKKEIPRLELSCTYDNNQKPKSATFFGVLNENSVQKN